MAVRFNNSVDQKIQLTGVLPSAVPATIMGWVYIVALPGNNSYFDYLSFSSGSAGSVNGTGMSIWNNAGDITWNIGTSGTDNPGGVPVASTWYHLTLVMPDTSTKTMYVNGVRDNSATVAGETNTQAVIGKYAEDTSGSGSKSNSRIERVRIWSAALNQSEIIAEMYSDVPVRKHSLRAHLPLRTHGDIRDYGIYQRAITQGSAALTTEDGMPFGLKPELVRRSRAVAEEAAGGEVGGIGPLVGGLLIDGNFRKLVAA
jgi:hypothetical protein